MTTPMPLSDHARETLRLALPLAGSHLAQSALHVTDTIMLGWYGVTELAAVVLGASSFFIIFILGAGFAQAVMPMVAAALGRGDEAQVRRDTRMGIWLSIGYGAVMYPLFWWSEPIFLALGQDADVAALAQDYMRVAGLGLIPALIVMALKSFLAAIDRAQVVLWVTVAGVFVNAAANYALIFGNWGAPELGVTGAALATLATQLASLLLMGLYAHLNRAAAPFRLWQRFWRADLPALKGVFRLGWPIGIQGVAEAGLFVATALMIGTIGKVQLAAHGIAMEVVSLIFMFHVGLANAATLRAGRADGAGDARGLRDGAKAALAMSFAVGLLGIVLFLAVPEWLIGLFLDKANPEAAAVVAYGTVLLVVAALFQMVDAGQVMAMGLLRGLRDTRVPMVIAAVSYWGVGIPAGWFLGLHLGLGGGGVWGGLVIGLLVAATALMWRFWRIAPQVGA
ncbi:MAG: MATE family efflux transporter [Rhodobacteraceae bacterium]|jgi:MATE family multidrug resistance protein|nr:MATE family efflux transporter [Paracoccaceae bacterium]